jgi:hypothetical protein
MTTVANLMSAFRMARNALLEDMGLVLSNSKFLSLYPFASENYIDPCYLFQSGTCSF